MTSVLCIWVRKIRSSGQPQPGYRPVLHYGRLRLLRRGALEMPAASTLGGTTAGAAPLPVVRSAVRSLLLASPAYTELPPEKKKQMAESMVRVCHAAVSLIQEEIVSN